MLHMMDLVHFQVIKLNRKTNASKQAFFLLFCWLCLCTSAHAEEWMQNIVDTEFQNIRPFSKKDVRTTWKELKKRTPDLLYYQIQNQVVYGPKNQIHDLLSAICAKHPMKDLDLLYYNQDCLPQSCFMKKNHYSPIFTSAKKIGDKNVILFADWYFNIANYDMSKINHIPTANSDSNSWTKLIPLINTYYTNLPWENRLSQMVWRGGTNDGVYTPDNWTEIPRGTLVHLANTKHPDLINANFSVYYPWVVRDQNFFISKIPPSSLLPTTQMEYKYQIDIDGITATFTSLSWKLLSGSVVFKQQSDNIMWFHPALEPWKHYIPVDRNLQDVPDKIMWALEHDEESHQIADNGRQFALTHLMPEHILLYCYLALCKYASLQRE